MYGLVLGYSCKDGKELLNSIIICDLLGSATIDILSKTLVPFADIPHRSGGVGCLHKGQSCLALLSVSYVILMFTTGKNRANAITLVT
jgi:hypothetical protein